MKLPAVVLVILFAGGITLDLYSSLAQFSSSHIFLLIGVLTAGCLLLAGLLFLSLHRLSLAAFVAGMIWILLGVLGACISVRPPGRDHVITFLNAGRIDLQTPRRWHGKLRDDPARLPWGFGYEIELSGFDYQGIPLKVQDGMRLSFTP